MARIRRGLQRGESPEPTQYRFYPNPAAYPAAFSSRLLDDSAPLAGHGKHRLMQLMEARKKCDAVDSTRYTEQARLMWAGKEFPEHVDDEQRKWYLCVQDCRQVRDAATELKTYASIEEADAMEEVADAPVTIDFASLHPSVRRTIIEEIKSEFPPGHYHDADFSVKEILQIPASTLQRIRQEDADVGNDVPEYALSLKQQNPDEIVDPDQPPPREFLKFVRFLEQMHLPGSLLGEWQFPVPPLKALFPFKPIRVTESIEPIEQQASDEEPWPGFNLQQNESFLEHVTNPFGKVLGGAGPVDEVSYLLDEVAYLQGPALDSLDQHLGLNRGAAAINNIFEDYKDPTRKVIDPSQISQQATAIPTSQNISTSRDPKLIFGGRALAHSTRAEMDADRLWAEHNFNNPNLLVKPQFLYERPKTSHQASIQRELFLKWSSVLGAKRINAILYNHKNLNHPDFEKLEAFEIRLQETAEWWQKHYVEPLTRKEQGQPPLPKTSEAPTRPQAKKKTAVPSSKRPTTPKLAAAQPNFGFDKSTKIVLFDRSMSSPGSVKRQAEAEATQKKTKYTGMPTPEDSP